MRLTIVQYAGDYREAYERFAAGGKATYQAQRYSVGFVGTLAERLEQVAVVCGLTETPYDVVLGNGVRAIGAGFTSGFDVGALIELVAATRPDRLCITTPQRPLIRWAIRNRIRTILQIADSFPQDGLRARFRNRMLARMLRDPTVEWVGNHGLNACLSLLDIGVPPRRIIPWDWPPSFSPHERSVRDRGEAPLTLAYVGSISEEKGVGDLIRAIATLRDSGHDVRLTVYGTDRDRFVERLSTSLAVGGRVHGVGPIANEDVPDAMRTAHAVVVPSRHAAAEGLPLTIYEALASRTPLIASDHPMFRGAVKDGESAVIFRASDADALADAVLTLDRDRLLYRRLSENSGAAWEALQLPVRWGALMERWLADGEEDRRWLADHAVASGRYDARLEERRASMRTAGQAR